MTLTEHKVYANGFVFECYDFPRRRAPRICRDGRAMVGWAYILAAPET